MAGIPVEIVRPKKTGSEAFSEFFAGMVLLFVSTWIVMLAAGALTTWHPGYWESMLALVALRAIQKPSSWLSWTRKNR